MTYPTGPANVANWLRRLRVDLHGRAAGVWVVDAQANLLRQISFDAALDLPREASERFALATREVPIDNTPLGIVGAVTTGQVTEMFSSDVPGQIGSAYWLGEFKTPRSVPVQIERHGRTVAAIAIALGSLEPSATILGEAIRTMAEKATWLDEL